MKFLNTLFIKVIVLLVVCASCSKSDDDASQANRSTEKIEVYIDGSTTPLLFNNNIVAQDNPMSASSGFNNVFTINAENTPTNPFAIRFMPTLNPAPFVVTTPSNQTITGNISNWLTIDGITFDDAASNSLTFSYTAFGPNTGNDIDMTISGTYYEVSDPLPHTLFVDIHIHRD